VNLGMYLLTNTKLMSGTKVKVIMGHMIEVIMGHMLMPNGHKNRFVSK